MSNRKVVLFFLLPILLSFILHFRVLNYDLIGNHVWRQSQTQTVIYNFSFSDNNIFHPQKFDLTTGSTGLNYEFPLYQWLIAQVNNCIGYSVLHTRVITFVFFIFILLGFYGLLRKFVPVETALITNCLLCFSPLLYYFCVNPLPDILALCFGVWSLKYFFAFVSTNKDRDFFIFSFLLLLAALVKLPFVLFGSGFLVYAYRALKKLNFQEVILRSSILLLALIPVTVWYVNAIPTWRDKGIVAGLANNNKTFMYLLDCFQFNLISTVPELITNYASCIFLVTGIYLFFKNLKQLKNTYGYFMVLFVCASFYFLFELNMIEKVHDYYLLPFVPLIFLVVAYGVKYFRQSKYKSFVYVVVLVVPFTAWLRINHRWNPEKPGFTVDYLQEQPDLQTLIPPGEKCIIDYDESHFVALYYLKRQGYSLFENELNPVTLKDRYLKGAHFLLTENLSLDPGIYTDFNFKELYSKNLKVYQLSLK